MACKTGAFLHAIRLGGCAGCGAASSPAGQHAGAGGGAAAAGRGTAASAAGPAAAGVTASRGGGRANTSSDSRGLAATWPGGSVEA